MSTEKNLQDIVNLMQRDDSIDAPSDSVRWANNVFRARAIQEPKRSLLKQLVAVMQMEIAPHKPAFGERSTGTAAVRQVLYRAGDSAIDLRIEAADKGFNVSGQILGPDFAGAAIILFEDSRSYETIANDSGEFRFDAVADGRYELTIRSETFEISLKAIDIE